MRMRLCSRTGVAGEPSTIWPAATSFVESGIEVEDDVVTEAAQASDDHAAVNTAAGPDRAFLADARKRIDAAIFADAGAGMDESARVDAVRRRLAPAV